MNDTGKPVLRQAARALLLGPGHRLLLFRFEDTFRGAVWWATPGGGLKPNETHEQAVLREVREETGHADVELGPWVWTRRDVYPSRGVLYEQEERFFLLRVPSLLLDLTGLESDEREFVRASRWWTISELEATTEDVAPSNLAALLRDLIEFGPPSEPIEVGR